MKSRTGHVPLIAPAHIAVSPGLPDLDLSPAQPRRPRDAAHHVPAAEWLWLAVAVLISLALRIPFFRIPMVPDEGGYAYATRGWLEGTGVLYGDLWISRPQGIFFLYAGIFEVFGTGTISLRFAAWIAAAITTVVVWAFARFLADPRSALVAAFVFAILSASPALEGYTANAEIFMGVPAALAALWLFYLSKRGWGARQLVVIGLLIGVTTSLKPSGAVMFPVAIGYIWMVGDFRDKRALVRRTLQVSAGVTIVAILSLLHGWYLGWDNFIYATFTYRLTAQSTATVGLEYNLGAIGRMIARCWSLISLVLLTTLLLNLHRLRGDFGASAIWTRIRRLFTRRGFGSIVNALRTPVAGTRPSGDGWLLLRLWLVGGLLGISIGGDWWAHYLSQITAPLSIWLGISFMRILPKLTRDGQRLVMPILGLLLLAPFWVLLLGAHEDMTGLMYGHPGYWGQEAVAAYLQQNTAPGTEIYVAFDQASIYYIADRPSAYRHLYDQELRGIPSSYSDLITIIQSPDRPEYIVGTRQPGPFADNSQAFWNEVGNYYFLEIRIEGVPIYRDMSQ